MSDAGALCQRARLDSLMHPDPKIMENVSADPSGNPSHFPTCDDIRARTHSEAWWRQLLFAEWLCL